MAMLSSRAGARIESISVFESVEDRDGMFQSGMESGMSESHDRLDEVLQREAEKIAT
jgi:hypothetical protein